MKGKGYFFAANKDFRFDSGVRLEPVCNSLPICSPPSFDLNLLDSGANDDQSTWTDKNGNHINYTDKEEVDVYCIYCPDTDECYYVNIKDFNVSVVLRVRSPQNNVRKGIKFAKDFRVFPP